MQNLVNVGRREGVCVGGKFSVIFCVPSIFIFLVFLPTPTGHTRRPITTVNGSKRMFPRKVGPFGGYKNFKLIFNVFIQNIQKNYNGAYWEN